MRTHDAVAQPALSRWLCTAVVALSLSGCQSATVHTVRAVGTPSPPVTASAGPAPHRSGTYDARSYANSPLPLDAYRESPADAAAVSQAATVLINRCRQRFGFPATVEPYLGKHAIDQFARRYSLVRDVVTARRYGYHPAELPRVPVPTSSAPAPLSAAENLVTYGTPDGSDNPTAKPSTRVAGQAIPEGGCTYEGYRAVGQKSADQPGGSPELYADTLQDEAFSQTQSDSRVLAVQGKWRSCMTAQGFHVRTPLDVTYDSAAPVPSANERAQAVADATCVQEVRLVTICLSVEVEHQTALIQRNLERLTATRRLIDDEVRRAAQISSSS